MFKKRQHLTSVKANSKVALNQVKSIPSVDYVDSSILHLPLKEQSVFSKTQNKLNQLEDLIGQISYLNQEIKSIIKK